MFGDANPKLVWGSGKLSAPSPSKKLGIHYISKESLLKMSTKVTIVFGSRIGMLFSSTKTMTQTITKQAFLIFRSLDFWILGFLDF